MIKNVHGNTLDWLGEAILTGHYPVGGSLPPEPVLCEELGVSRTVVREAIKSLVAKGLVVTGPKVGTRVLPQDEWNWFDPSVIAWQARNGLSVEFLQDLHADGGLAGLAPERLDADPRQRVARIRRIGVGVIQHVGIDEHLNAHAPARV